MVAEFWYPPTFDQWPAAARGAWYSVNTGRGEAVCEVRKGIGVENPEKSERFQKLDMAAAVEQLSGGERVLRADTSNTACLSVVAEEASLEEDVGAKLTIKQLGVVASELRNTFPTSPVLVGESW